MAPQSRRYFVPDLTPRDRKELRGVRFRYVFVAESPHVSEVEPELEAERRPLCGSAGKAWWAMLGETLEERAVEDLGLENLLRFCRKHRIAVMNAVQFPLDPKIVARVHDPFADPARTLGFSKEPGPTHYRRAARADMERALGSLRERILDPGLNGAKVVALGNDAEWFIRRALTSEELELRAQCKIAHPSAWWRRGGHFGRCARQTLQKLF